MVVRGTSADCRGSLALSFTLLEEASGTGFAGEVCCSSGFLGPDDGCRFVGDGERILKSLRLFPRLAASWPSGPSFIPGNWSSPSPRGIGVASVSTETTERMGKTRSTVPGENEKSPRVGEAGEPGLLSVAPEKMLMLVCRGDTPILVCIEEAVRATDCDIEMPCSERIDVRELVEAVRDEVRCG